MTRRETLGALAAGAASLGLGAAPRPSRMPTIFVAHGAPMVLDVPTWVADQRAWADALPRPRAILMLSAHWERRPVTIGATRRVPLIYDFYGFPAKYYAQTYPAPGAPELAARVRELLGELGPVAEAPDRGLDHGAYVPLVAMFPAADIPVLQVSLPGLEPRAVLALGRALAPLRDEGVLLVGSGQITHNLRLMDFRPGAEVPAWAQEFDAWTAEVLARRDADGLADFMRKGPGAQVALPTTEHFVPLLAAFGAAQDDPVRCPITGFWGGSGARRSVQFG